MYKRQSYNYSDYNIKSEAEEREEYNRSLSSSQPPESDATRIYSINDISENEPDHSYNDSGYNDNNNDYGSDDDGYNDNYGDDEYDDEFRFNVTETIAICTTEQKADEIVEENKKDGLDENESYWSLVEELEG